LKERYFSTHVPPKEKKCKQVTSAECVGAGASRQYAVKFMQHVEIFPCVLGSVLSIITLATTSRGKIMLFDIILTTFW
jgi:hypothetical protein